MAVYTEVSDEELAAFMDELVNGKVPYGCVRPEEALDSHRVFTAAVESQRTRQAVEIP